MYKVFLGIGGNLGNKRLNFEKVHIYIEKELGAIVKKSAVYETQPWGFSSEDNFWNQVLMIETVLEPGPLLSAIHAIENRFGRKREQGKYISRQMDIDILYFNDLVLETETLVIPHPHISRRLFVLAPLAEIAPGFLHPKLQVTNRHLLKNCTDKSVVKRL